MVDYWWDVHDGHALPSLQAQLTCSKACAAITDGHGSSDDASMASTCVQDDTGSSAPTKLGTEHMLRMLLAHDEASSGVWMHVMQHSDIQAQVAASAMSPSLVLFVLPPYVCMKLHQ